MAIKKAKRPLTKVSVILGTYHDFKLTVTDLLTKVTFKLNCSRVISSGNLTLDKSIYNDSILGALNKELSPLSKTVPIHILSKTIREVPVAVEDYLTTMYTFEDIVIDGLSFNFETLEKGVAMEEREMYVPVNSKVVPNQTIRL